MVCVQYLYETKPTLLGKLATEKMNCQGEATRCAKNSFAQVKQGQWMSWESVEEDTN